MPLRLVSANLVTMPVGAVVNAANNALAMGGGVCGAIFRAAGPERLSEACRAIGFCPTGGAVLTPGFDLGARWIIHTVGPVWRGGSDGEPEELRNCFLNSLALAAERGLPSVAFPLISTGIFGYPRGPALTVALAAIRDFLAQSAERPVRPAMEVYITLMGSADDLADPDLPPRPAASEPSAPDPSAPDPASSDPLARLRSLVSAVHPDRLAAAANLQPERLLEIARGANPAAPEILALGLALGLGPDQVRAALAAAGAPKVAESAVWDVAVRYLALGGASPGPVDLGRVNRSLFAMTGVNLP